VLAIRAGTVPTSPSHQWLGGQHGEEAKDEDEGSGQEGCEEDQAEKEEVGICRSQSSTSTDVDDCVTRAGGCRGGLALRDRIRLRRLRSTTEGVGETGVSSVTGFPLREEMRAVNQGNGEFPDLAVAGSSIRIICHGA
jgi:hypothetical protein